MGKKGTGGQHCYGCKRAPRTEEFFGKSKSTAAGFDDYCRQCKANRYEKYKDAQRNAFLLKHYGLTPEQFDKLVQKQCNCCAICKIATPGNTGCKKWTRSRWHVDHDHKTNQVRGLLCHRCNRMLGLANDCVIILQNSISYLSKGVVT